MYESFVCGHVKFRNRLLKRLCCNGTQPFRHGSYRILLLGPNFSFDNKTQRDSNLDPVSRCAPFVVSLVVLHVDVTKFIIYLSLFFVHMYSRNIGG